MKHVPWITLIPRPEGSVLLRKKFNLENVPRKVKCRVSGLGFYELYINGRRVGDARLEPPFTRYDVRIAYREYEVSEYLQPGENCCLINLGRGWYSGEYADVHASNHASYRHLSKAALRLFTLDNQTILQTSEDWEAAPGAVQHDSPRTGEVYDANLLEPAQWIPARQVLPPGGKLFKPASAPVVCLEPIKYVSMQQEAPQTYCYDFGKNLTGTIQLFVRGSSGSKVTLRYGELCDAERKFSQDNINWYLMEGEFQTDRYILRGDKDGENWMPTFSYHGYRYVQAVLEGDAEIVDIQAVPLCSNFAEIGSLTSSDPDFNNLLQAIKQSLVSNYVGYPSDCPHREKNAWLADAHLAADSMLCWFDAAEHYNDFIDAIFDYQRANGQLPGMALGSGFGWHWDFGPVWTVAPILLGYSSYLANGKSKVLRRHYENMKKYLEFCWDVRKNSLVQIGPAEWKDVTESTPASAAIVDSSLIFYCLQIMSKLAEKFGKLKDQELFQARADELKTALQNVEPGHVTDLAVLICCGLGNANYASRLDELIRKNEYKAICGIVGAKYIPRALAEYGYIDTAYQMFVQHQYPGWQWMLDHGATTLWENWLGNESCNHPMMGDAAAWAVRYLAGISILEPQFKRFVCKPQYPAQLQSFAWQLQLPAGKLACSWLRNKKGKIELSLTVPAQSQAEYISADGSKQILNAGEYKFTV